MCKNYVYYPKNPITVIVKPHIDIRINNVANPAIILVLACFVASGPDSCPILNIFQKNNKMIIKTMIAEIGVIKSIIVFTNPGKSEKGSFAKTTPGVKNIMVVNTLDIVIIFLYMF